MTELLAPASAGDGAWRRTSPIGVLFFLGRALKQLLSSFSNLAALAAGTLVLVKQHPLLAVLAVGVGVFAIVAAAVLRYWFFRFKIDGERIRVRQGVFRKTELDLRFERIQGINTEQSLVFRMLGLMTVRFDTAGSAGDEGALPAVHPDLVALLRQRIDAVRHDAAGTQPTAVLQNSGEVLVHLTSRDLLRVGLTDPSALRVALLGAAFATPLSQAFEGAVTAAAETIEASVTQLVGLGGFVVAVVLLACVLGIVGLFVVGSIVAAFLRFSDYELRQEDNALRSRAGLLTRKETVVEVAKIQRLRVVQGLLMRWLGHSQLQVLPAGVHEEEQTSKLMVPFVADGGLKDIQRRAFAPEGQGLGSVPSAPGYVAVSPYAIWPPVLWCGILPAGFGAVATSILFGPVGLSCLVWVLPVGVVAWQRWRRWGYRHDDDGIVVRSGFLGRRTDALLFRKAQYVALSQSPLQRRRELAGLRIGLAAGNVSIPFIDLETARRLRDYILFKAESSTRPWY